MDTEPRCPYVQAEPNVPCTDVPCTEWGCAGTTGSCQKGKSRAGETAHHPLILRWQKHDNAGGVMHLSAGSGHTNTMATRARRTKLGEPIPWITCWICSGGNHRNRQDEAMWDPIGLPTCDVSMDRSGLVLASRRNQVYYHAANHEEAG